jgi:hypothetical protein
MSVSLEAKPTVETGRRPAAVRWTIGVLTFLGITALGGGIEMLLFYEGNEYLPADLIERTPFDTFIVPGLILGGIFGLGSLFVAWGIWRRPDFGLLHWLERLTDRHWAWAGAVLLGLGFTMWMVIEISMLGSPWDTANAGEAAMTWALYGIYVTVAVLLLVLPQLSRVREYMERSALE